MQPYLFPYIGYWQLINAVDKFVVYDNIQYTKKGWINRNRYLIDGRAEYFSIPVAKADHLLDIRYREVAPDFNKKKLLNTVAETYMKAPFFHYAYSLFENLILFEDKNLFNFIFNSIKEICNFLFIKTEIIISSSIRIDHSLKAQDKVLAVCKELGADTYINPIGGTELYSKYSFKENSIDLKFLKTDPIEYNQFKNQFLPYLSIIDIMMFNSKEETIKLLQKYTAI